MYFGEGFHVHVVQASRAAFVALTCKPTPNCASGAISGTVNGGVEIFLGIFDHDIGKTRYHHLNVAAFVCSTARTVNIRKSHQYTLDMIVSGAQCKTQTSFNVAS
jgi:hypothetical protein